MMSSVFTLRRGPEDLLSTVCGPVLPQDELELLAASGSPAQRRVLKRAAAGGPASPEQRASPSQRYTEDALRELFRHVNHNMPDSAKKKKLVRQVLLGSGVGCSALLGG